MLDTVFSEILRLVNESWIFMRVLHLQLKLWTLVYIQSILLCMLCFILNTFEARKVSFVNSIASRFSRYLFASCALATRSWKVSGSYNWSWWHAICLYTCRALYPSLSLIPPRVSCDPAKFSEFPGQNGRQAWFAISPLGGYCPSRSVNSKTVSSNAINKQHYDDVVTSGLLTLL